MTIKKVALGDIRPDPNNVRSEIDEDSIKDLAASILGVGLLTPLLTRPAKDDDGAKYHMIRAGHRRHRALTLLADQGKLASVPNLTDGLIPVDDQTTDDATVTAQMLVENLQRVDISPLDEARGFQTLATTHKMKQAEIARTVGRSGAHITKRLALLKLPVEVAARAGHPSFTLDHAYELANLPDDLAAPLIKEIRKGRFESIEWTLAQAKRTAQFRADAKKLTKLLADAVIVPVEDTPSPVSHYEIVGSFNAYDLTSYTAKKGDVVQRRGEAGIVTVWRKLSAKQLAEQAEREAARVADPADPTAVTEDGETPWDRWAEQCNKLVDQQAEEFRHIEEMRRAKKAELIAGLTNKELLRAVVETVQTSSLLRPNAYTVCRFAGLEPARDERGNLPPSWDGTWRKLADGWLATDTNTRLLQVFAFDKGAGATIQGVLVSVGEAIPEPPEPDQPLEPWLDDAGVWHVDEQPPAGYEIEDGELVALEPEEHPEDESQDVNPDQPDVPLAPGEAEAIAAEKEAAASAA